MIIHVTQVVGIFVVLLFFGLLLVIGVVCFVLGLCLGGCWCWGGMRRLFFLKSCTRNLRYYKSPELGLNLSGS